MISLGLDIGTTTLRATVVEARRDGFAPLPHAPLCTLTPYAPDGNLAASSVFENLDQWCVEENIPTPEVGTALFTGEAQRTANAREVADRLLARWPCLLAAQLDPELESTVAAHGAGAVALSAARPGKTIVHIDIGGGTSNFARIENGVIVDTACLDIGGRKWIVDPNDGRVLRRARTAAAFDRFDDETALRAMRPLAGAIVDFLDPASAPGSIVVPWKRRDPMTPIVSLSGGVAECWGRTESGFRYGDLGPYLARALADALAGYEVHLSPTLGRATALGISAFGFQVSGNSLHGEDLRALRNVSVWDAAQFDDEPDVPPEVAITISPDTASVSELEKLADAWLARFRMRAMGPSHLIVFLMKANLAKAFGYLLTKRASGLFPRLWALDGIDVNAFPAGRRRTLDVGALTADGAVPVVVKTLRLF